MSKKYTLPFLIEQTIQKDITITDIPVTESSISSDSFWSNRKKSISLNASNKFDVLSDDFHLKKDKPIVNTSLPAKEAPKLIPATLASITTNGSGSYNGTTVIPSFGSNKSFASKFSEHQKKISNPNYKPPPKPIDITSENDFPCIRASNVTKLISNNEVIKPLIPSTNSFAEKAKEWAKQKKEVDDEIIRKILEDEKRVRESELNIRMNIIGFGNYRRKHITKYDEYDEDNNDNNEESSLGDDSYEVPEEDEEPSEEDDNEEDESNQPLGSDGRRKNDLY